MIVEVLHGKNFWGKPETVSRGTFIALYTCIGKEEKLKLYQKMSRINQEKEEEKIRAELLIQEIIIQYRASANPKGMSMGFCGWGRANTIENKEEKRIIRNERNNVIIECTHT